MFSSKSEVKMDAKPRSRANTVIGQIKWWTSSNQPFHTNNTNTPATNNTNIKSFGSSVAVQKLRESKWFGPDESRIFCAVIECGFIVETREGQENDGWFGIVNCKTSKGKHPISLNRNFFHYFTTTRKNQNLFMRKTRNWILLHYELWKKKGDEI